MNELIWKDSTNKISYYPYEHVQAAYAYNAVMKKKLHMHCEMWNWGLAFHVVATGYLNASNISHTRMIMIIIRYLWQ